MVRKKILGGGATVLGNGWLRVKKIMLGRKVNIKPTIPLIFWLYVAYHCKLFMWVLCPWGMGSFWDAINEGAWLYSVYTQWELPVEVENVPSGSWLSVNRWWGGANTQNTQNSSNFSSCANITTWYSGRIKILGVIGDLGVDLVGEEIWGQ